MQIETEGKSGDKLLLRKVSILWQCLVLLPIKLFGFRFQPSILACIRPPIQLIFFSTCYVASMF